MLITVKRFAHQNSSKNLTRSILSTYPSPWRYPILPRITPFCRFQTTASLQGTTSRPNPPSAVLLSSQKNKSSGGSKNKSSRGSKKRNNQLSNGPKTKMHRGEKVSKQGKSSAPKSNLNKTSSAQRSKKLPSKSHRTLQANRKELNGDEHITLDEVRQDVYNICARSFIVPEHHCFKKEGVFIVRLSLPEQDILIEEKGTIWRAELTAYLKLKKAIEDKAEAFPNSSDSTFSLNESNAAQFLRFYGKRHRCERFEENMGSRFGGTYAQIDCAGQSVSNSCFARRGKEAVALAWLAAAVAMAQKHAELFHEFQHAERGNDGEILTSLRPIDFNIVPAMLMDMESSSRSLLASTSANADPASSSRRFWSDLSRPRPNYSDDPALRNVDLFQRHEAFLENPDLAHIRSLKDGLPMNQRRAEILRLVNSNTYSIIVGATGSGKTTQVPQIILEDAILGKRGADINVICTQPRRIAAKSVAVRVASERNESLGETVGYHVRGESRTCRQSGQMTFCTTGILLKQLQTDPDRIMDTASHVIIDEVHERDTFIDFLMITLKKIIEERQRSRKRIPNVVLMSATMDTNLFAKYFQQPGSEGRLEPCPSIFVPGRTFPVKEKYIETILDELNQSYSKRDLKLLEDRDTKDYLRDEVEARHTRSLDQRDTSSIPANEMKDAIVPVSLVATTIAHICRSTTEGAILAFLPGLQEIVSTEKLLLQNPLGVDFSDTSKFKIFKLHSSLKDNNQDEIFQPVPTGCRKIIISTNIAETSVTIPDVQHVVDSGKLREKRYNQLVQITKLQCVWVSKSNMRQRAGRAGRVQNGNYYALYSSSRYDSLEITGRPEMLRSDLMEICLEVKAYSKYRIGEFLAGAIEPPDPIAVDASVQDLKDLEALGETEDLTPLGKLLASLPVHPSLGKMIILGVIFRCLDPLLILGAAANERPLFVRPLGVEKEADKVKESFAHGTYSDQLTTINAFRECRKSLISDIQYGSRIPPFFAQNFVHFGAFKAIDRTMREIESLLENVGVIPKGISDEQGGPHQCGHASLNQNSNNASLIRALVLAGQRGNLAVNMVTHNPRFSTQKESRAMINRSSMNHFIGQRKSRDAIAKSEQMPCPTILSFGSRHLNDQNDITLRETSIISPLIAILFGGELKTNGTNPLVTVGDRFQFYIKSAYGYRAPAVVRQFRRGVDTLFSNAFNDLAEQKTLADDPTRDRFAREVAHIIDQDFKLYMSTGSREGSSEESGRQRGDIFSRTKTERRVMPDRRLRRY